MKLPVQVTFRDIPHSDAVAEHICVRVDKLDTFFDGIMRCHVVVEAPHRHHREGKRYNVTIDMTVPGEELFIGRNPAESLAHEDLHAAIESAFDDAVRVLQDYVRRRRGDVKAHELRSTARVSKIFAYEGYGFLETEDGRDIYFHRNSVLHGAFDRLEVGAKVAFDEELGEKGPQASTVVRIGS